MNPEILKLKARLAENKTRYKELDMDVSEILKSLRMKADPYEEDVTKLRTDEVLHLAKKLDTAISEMKKIKEYIEKMENDLGV